MYSRDPSPAVSTQLDEALRDAANRFIADEDLPGASLAILRDGVTASAHAGTRDVAGARTADDQTLYRIASISKTFTAWTVVALRDAALLSLDDAVVDRLPEFAAVRDPFGPVGGITIRMLLQHTSGLQSEPPGDVPEPWRPRPIADVLSRLDRTAVVIPPGSAFKYSNVGYDLLGELIARVSGAPYGACVRHTILDPLDMGATALDPPADARAIGFDPRERREPGEPWRQAVDHGPNASQASSGWWSSIEDLAGWARTQLRLADARAALSIASLEEMHAPAVATDDRGGAYGLGWRVAERGGRVVVGHGGSTYGFEAILGFDLAARTAAIALVNGIPSTSAMLDLRDRLLDLASDPSRTASAGTPPRSSGGAAIVRAVGAGPVGTFREVGFRNEVTIAPGPVLEAGGTSRPLQPTADPLRFLVGSGRAVGESLTFVHDASGEVAAVELGGYYFERIPGPTHERPGSPSPAREESP
jgi:CubicO group peptidase (beta-lactamase class C family)